MTRPIVSIRFAPGGIKRIDEIAAEEKVKRSTVMDALVEVGLSTSELTRAVEAALRAEAEKGPHRASTARKGTSIRLDDSHLDKIRDLVATVAREHQGRMHPDRSTAIRLLFHVGLTTPTGLAAVRRILRGNTTRTRALARAAA